MCAYFWESWVTTVRWSNVENGKLSELKTSSVIDSNILKRIYCLDYPKSSNYKY